MPEHRMRITARRARRRWEDGHSGEQQPWLGRIPSCVRLGSTWHGSVGTPGDPAHQLRVTVTCNKSLALPCLLLKINEHR